MSVKNLINSAKFFSWKNNALYFTIFFIGFSLSGFSQDNPEIKDIKILYKKEMSGSIIAHTSGWGINFRKGNHITGKRKGILEIDLVSMKHNKEVKTYNPYFNNPKSFIYGKLNSFTILRTGYGFLQVLNEKPYRGGVEVGCLFAGGIDVGFLKPIYVIVLDSSDYFNEYFSVKKYSNEINQDFIYGKASFIKGFDEIKFKFGAFGKLGFNFDFGSYYEFVKALQVGAVFDIYPKPVPIMALAKNNSLFVSFYLSLNLGKRYN